MNIGLFIAKYQITTNEKIYNEYTIIPGHCDLPIEHSNVIYSIVPISYCLLFSLTRILYAIIIVCALCATILQLIAACGNQRRYTTKQSLQLANAFTFAISKHNI
jgi:hypothetical protein